MTPVQVLALALAHADTIRALVEIAQRAQVQGRDLTDAEVETVRAHTLAAEVRLASAIARQGPEEP